MRTSLGTLCCLHGIWKGLMSQTQAAAKHDMQRLLKATGIIETCSCARGRQLLTAPIGSHVVPVAIHIMAVVNVAVGAAAT